jgi:hypothetical protein
MQYPASSFAITVAHFSSATILITGNLSKGSRDAVELYHNTLLDKRGPLNLATGAARLRV